MNARRRMGAETAKNRGLLIEAAVKSISATELLALAIRREAICTQVVRRAKEFRHLQIEAVEQLLVERSVDSSEVPPAAVVTIISALTRAIAQDCALGVDEGYQEVVACFIGLA